MDNKDLQSIQEQIGYNFKNTDLLQQAFVRRSYSQENGGENNEVLEFIGDKALDFAVVKILAEKFGHVLGGDAEFYEFACEYRESKLSELKKKMVQKSTLANRIDARGFADYLIMGNGDIKNKVDREASVMEDLFEAIIGAVALDSGWNLEDIQSAVELLLDSDSILSDDNEQNYVELIQEWTLWKYGVIPRYHFDLTSQGGWYSKFSTIVDTFYGRYDGSERYLCDVKLGDYNFSFMSFGKSKNEARKKACKLAYEHLEKNDLLFSIADEIENPNKDDSIGQLETLARRGYFSVPVYTFSQTFDYDGNPIWKSTCRIAEESRSFSAESSAKKEAKKLAAYEMLKYVLNK